MMLTLQSYSHLREGRKTRICLPALVPIHSRSLQASNAVILRQAALCCLMIASAPEHRGGNKKMARVKREW